MIIVKRDTTKGNKMKASEKLAKAVCEALNSNDEIREIIAAAGENAEQVKSVMYDMLWAKAIMNDEILRSEIEAEAFTEVMERIV